MYGTVTIGGKDVEMVANAASPFRYKQVFREDFLKKAFESNGKEAESVSLFVKMGFIMMKQAEKADFNKLNENSFFEWLESFEDPNAVIDAVREIAEIYSPNAETKSTPKKKADRQSEK